MTLLNFPGPPLTPGQTYAAPNGVTYTWDPTVGTGVWTAVETAPTPTLTITNPGTIAGTAEVGATLTYTTGTATGGVGAISYTWQWFITPSTPIGPVGTQGSITVPAGALNKNIYVTLTATDSATPTANTATANTSNYPTPPATIQPAGITNAAAPTTIPGTANFTWADGNQNLTATGCIEFSVNGGSSFTQASTAVGNGTNIITRWKNTAGSGTCGDAPQGTTITGTLTDGTRTSTFNFTINRVPAAFSMTPNTESTTPLTITTANPTFTLSGCNTAPLIWGTLTGGGSLPEFSIDGGTTWVTLPSAPTSGVYVPVGTPAKVRFKTSSGAGTETLDVYAGASTTASEYRSSLFTVTVATAPFPVTSFAPPSAPNASPPTVNAVTDPNLGQLNGTANTSWASGTQNNVISTGALQFTKNGGAVITVPTTVNDLDTIDVFWNPTTVSASPDTTNLTGTLTNGTYTNTFSFTVDKAPDLVNFFPADSNSNGPNASVTTNPLTPFDYNSRVDLYAVGGANPMLNPTVSINTTGPFPLPTTPGTLFLDPGDQIEIFADLGPTPATYSLIVHIGSSSATWAETAVLVPTVSPPVISGPTNGQTNVKPQYNSPAGVSVSTSGSFSSSGGAGTNHASTDWELATDAAFSTIVYSASASTTYLTTWFIPMANLTPSQTYYLRARYTSGTDPGGTGIVTTSAYSTVVSFTMTNSFALQPGTPMAGGYFAGQISTAGNGVADYNLIVAPLSSGSLEGQKGAINSGFLYTSYKTSATSDANPPSQNAVYGQPATVAFNNAAHPLFSWCLSDPIGPNAGTYDATNSTGTGIGGYNDWYIPSGNELLILYFFLKPDTTANYTLGANGSNPNSVSPYTPNTGFGPGFPGQTTADGTNGTANFQGGGAQAFVSSANANDRYWSSTEWNGNAFGNFADLLPFSTGTYGSTGKTSAGRARAIRRIPV